MNVSFPGMVEYVLKSHYAGLSRKNMFEIVVDEFKYDKDYDEFKRYYARLIYRVNKKIDKIEIKDTIENNNT